MVNPDLANRTLRLAYFLLVAVTVGALFYAAYFVVSVFSSIFFYLLVSIVLSGILQTPTDYLSSRYVLGVRLPRVVAILISFVMLVALFAAFVLLFVPLVSDQIQVISNLNYEEFVASVQPYLRSLEDVLVAQDIIEPGSMRQTLLETVREFVQENLNIGQIVRNVFGSTLAIAGNLATTLLALFFITFFLLYEKGLVKRLAISLIPNRYFEVSIVALTKVELRLGNYLLGILMQMTAIFTVATIGLMILGVPNAMSIALFTAVANLIPYLGPALGAGFGLFVGLTTAEWLETSQDYALILVGILIVFSVVQLVDNILLQPIIFSKSVKAHPLEIFLIVFVGARLGGLAGMILAIPAYTIVRVTAMEFLSGYRSYRVFRRNSAS